MPKNAWLPLVCSVLACFLVWWRAGDVKWGIEPNKPVHTVNHLVASISGNSHLPETGDKRPVVMAVKTADTLALIDLPGVSEETLGKHWKQLNPTERDEFMTLFAQLLVRIAFPQSAAFFRNLKMTVTNERIRGHQAIVNTYVEHAIEGKIDIDYHLMRHDKGWLVYDVQLDGVSLSRNLRAQFQQIIRQDSYAELLRRMREKLEQATASASS